MAIALFALGSVVGTPLAGFLVSRYPARSVLPAALVASAMTLGAVGQASQSITLVIIFLAAGTSARALTQSERPHCALRCSRA